MAHYRYGTPNFEMLGRWLDFAPEDDGPFWALNLMRYREVADYVDGSGAAISGREADDRYTPTGPLTAIGASIVFVADVESQNDNQPQWHRVGIVRYPTRRAFFEMQQRDDFKRQHVHKDAGMESTIVMSCLPVPDAPPATVEPFGDGPLVLRVLRTRGGAEPATLAGSDALLALGVEGVIVGDERAFDAVRFERAGASTPPETTGAEEEIVMTVRPNLDQLAASVAAG